MSHVNAELVEQLFEIPRQERPAGWSAGLFREDICYELSIARAMPISASFRGRQEVETYLSILQVSYQMLVLNPRTVLTCGDEVIVRGSETAWLTVSNQTVKAEWVAVVKIAEGMIKSISMSIYRWTILSDLRTRPRRSMSLA